MQWKPIKTAPKDRLILVAFVARGDVYPTVREARWHERNGAFCSANGVVVYDTAYAWCDYPEPPDNPMEDTK